MFHSALLAVLASTPSLVTALVPQVPLVFSPQQPSEHPNAVASTQWRLDEYPNPNATDHLVFETVHSLLQRWPNTRMRNGHNIVPGVIPKGTFFYHGTDSERIPSVPEWVALDPEFSYLFCQPEEFKPECWQLTLMTTRELKVVYFDGASAAKFPHGPLDTQDLFIWGESSPDRVYNEPERIQDLCKWGEKFGVDGFVRMADNFEVMLCSFTSGVRVVSFLNLQATGPPSYIVTGPVMFQVVTAGSWHDRFPGETRVKLDVTGLVSFYDTDLVPSLVSARAGQERWDHRVQPTSGQDLAAIRSRVEAALTRPSGQSSRIDWKTLVQVIVDRYAGRLELIRYLLNTPATNADEVLDLANKTQTQLRVILTPYILFSATPTESSNEDDLDWTAPIYELCATTHTSYMESRSASLTDSERLILKAVQGTNQEICRVVTKMWATGVYAGLDPSLNKKETFDMVQVARIRNVWTEELDRLMAWLDWSVWIKCNPECSPEEMCYMPSWPIGFPGFPPPSRLPHHPDDSQSIERRGLGMSEWAQSFIKPGPNDWVRPQPKCIRRVDTFEF